MAEPTDQTAFADKVAAEIARKLDTRRKAGRIVWFGLGTMGLIGWSVTVPTLLGVALGLWLDRHTSTHHSWTLALLMVGLSLGCWNAWHWMTKEGRNE
jgi:ATP synthase protein I